MATRLTASEILQQQLDHLGVTRPGDVGWAHGANNQARLKTALADPAVHYLEGDISLDDRGYAIMAHPPATTSDLRFTDWLGAIVAAGKGAKLDFKSPAVVERCLDEANRQAAGRIPLMINADLVMGPGGQPPIFDPGRFLALHKSMLPQCILSPGWRVGDNGISYSREMLGEMRDLLSTTRGPITLPFHAWYLFSSWPDVKWLLGRSSYTMTIWGRIDAPELLAWLGKRTDPNRCFYDMQDADGIQLSVTSEQ